MASIDTKKKIVSQANNITTPNATSITTPKINQYSSPSSVAKTSGAPGALTGVKANSTLAPTATATSMYSPTSRPPANPVDIMKPSIDAGRQRDETYLTEWQKQTQDKLNAEYDDQVRQLNDSKRNAESQFNQGKTELGDTLYNQSEATNIDATRRGISYSPQALGLQGVHNINYNKNLTKLMEQKNSLLADIDSKINSLGVSHSGDLADLSLEMLKQRNDGSKDYDKQLSDIMMHKYDQDYNKYLTDDEREYERYLTDDERAYNQSVNKSGYSGGGGYGGGGGYSSNFSPYARKPWEDWSSNWEDWSNSTGSPGGSGVDYTNPSVLNAGMQSYKNASTDAYNAISRSDTTPTLNNYFDMSSLYGDSMSLYDDAFKNAPKEYRDEIAKTKQIADNHLFNRARANSTNTPYKSGNTYITPALPWNKKTIAENKAKGNVISKVRKGNDYGAKIDSKAFDIDKKIKSSAKKSVPKKVVTKPKKAPVKTKYEKKVEDNAKKQVKKTVTNVKKAITKLFTKPKAKPTPKAKAKSNNRR